MGRCTDTVDLRLVFSRRLLSGSALRSASPEMAASRRALQEHDNNPSRLVNKYLDSVADHKVRHRPTSNLPFHPIVLSLVGMMNGSTTKVFASWKRVMTRGTYNLMLKRLSLCLLQARVRSFEL
ncbi:hypothetical protein EHS25_007182 [Saitozyma podzolica]|jgi:hypothetical protein|uniref:Uncharacterized protein n=1 Tax=Saitozyma podzolica TaxID=1890683 RepID=A0A427XPE6_9TREE|nr:hypothetical protein EHS25_007182 [Saitozyma podzolica]